MPARLAPPPTENATRREFLALLAAGGLLTACGTPPAGPGPAATRTVTDLSGRTVDIPADPRRIVALDPNRVITDLVALGIVPVGATTNPTNPGGAFAETLDGGADGMERVGATGEADLERVAALAPDLIFHATDYQEIPVERLEAIAPTIVYPRAPSGLLEPVRWLGGLLGREARAASVEQELRDALAGARDAIGLAGRRVAVVNLGNYEPGPVVSVAAPGTNVGEFAELLGATVVPTTIDGTAVGRGTFTEISVELLPSVLADAEFVIGLRYGGSAENDRLFAARAEDPLWRAVPAVAAGEVAYLDIQRAGGNIGVAGVRLALDDLVSQRA
ncbi:MAG: ABC transporter substrate-binding protein [Pseudonocardiales bacterium]|nr:ABC transporter substrate-binding protein [Pseudonocardiales bacterium]